jgi:hypothetical protein
MLLGFMRYFDKARKVPTNFMVQIIGGQKIHSFRIDKHRRWNAGRVIDFCYGVRTKSFEKFWKGSCDGIQEFAFWFNKSGKIQVQLITEENGKVKYGSMYGPVILGVMARNDGFKNIEDFSNYFRSYPLDLVEDGSGIRYMKLRCIHWTSFRYPFIPFTKPFTPTLTPNRYESEKTMDRR